MICGYVTFGNSKVQTGATKKQLDIFWWPLKNLTPSRKQHPGPENDQYIHMKHIILSHSDSNKTCPKDMHTRHQAFQQKTLPWPTWHPCDAVLWDGCWAAAFSLWPEVKDDFRKVTMITMENHHFPWLNQRTKRTIFNSKLLNYQRVTVCSGKSPEYTLSIYLNGLFPRVNVGTWSRSICLE